MRRVSLDECWPSGVPLPWSAPVGEGDDRKKSSVPALFYFAQRIAEGQSPDIVGRETVMPVYISLIKWTDQGRGKVSSLPDRIAEVDKRIEALGGRSIGNWLTMGRFDQVAVVEAPDDETAAKLLMVVAERGNAVTETLRAFTMDEVRGLLA